LSDVGAPKGQADRRKKAAYDAGRESALGVAVKKVSKLLDAGGPAPGAPPSGQVELTAPAAESHQGPKKQPAPEMPLLPIRE
jgi:hypothetical protein